MLVRMTGQIRDKLFRTFRKDDKQRGFESFGDHRQNLKFDATLTDTVILSVEGIHDKHRSMIACRRTESGAVEFQALGTRMRQYFCMLNAADLVPEFGSQNFSFIDCLGQAPNR